MTRTTGRTAYVGSMILISVSLSGIIQFGDSMEFEPETKALAVKRELDHQSAGEAYFEDYKVFRKPLPSFPAMAFFDSGTKEDNLFSLSKTTCCPDIHVGSIHVVDTSTSSMIKAGNGGSVFGVSRSMEIRQFAYRRMGMR